MTNPQTPRDRAAEIIYNRTARLSRARSYDLALLAARDLAADGLLLPEGAHEEEDYRIAPFEEVDGAYISRRYTRLVTPWQLAPLRPEDAEDLAGTRDADAANRLRRVPEDELRDLLREED